MVHMVQLLTQAALGVVISSFACGRSPEKSTTILAYSLGTMRRCMPTPGLSFQAYFRTSKALGISDVAGFDVTRMNPASTCLRISVNRADCVEVPSCQSASPPSRGALIAASGSRYQWKGAPYLRKTCNTSATGQHCVVQIENVAGCIQYSLSPLCTCMLLSALLCEFMPLRCSTIALSVCSALAP